MTPKNPTNSTRSARGREPSESSRMHPTVATLPQKSEATDIWGVAAFTPITKPEKNVLGRPETTGAMRSRSSWPRPPESSRTVG